MALQKACVLGVSLGLINKMVRPLRDEAWLMGEAGGRGRGRDPFGPKAYRFDRHRRIGYFSLLKPEQLGTILEGGGGQDRGQAAYAAFSAAEIQAPTVRPSSTWLYLLEDFVAEFERFAEAK